ncbi:hypothetical protein PFICI_00402 [Pestalotiopsis fici W106-1]|uniref:Uncharacterized protein n=1 Tax=Pestalotiopsis fici (strain W106-1 / CGMCC3.15140) TaxID=1229662 RepID=W3XKN4_PESFW|nr:uncharacterized protein PFICI_00402 [Pestalotiopsis fici W106-1]ETS86574.1 hypothetical protein PFICI_00402 [Pestalotiopsis fici W106-1]
MTSLPKSPDGYLMASHVVPSDSHEDLDAAGNTEIYSTTAAPQCQIDQDGEVGLGLIAKWLPFLALVPTTILSIVLFAGNAHNWVAPDSTYSFISTNRTVSQVAVQVIAYTLGMLNTSVVCRLLQYITRKRLSTRSISLDSLRFWTGIQSQKLLTNIPVYMSTSLAFFCLLSVGPSAVWTGALTPIEIISNRSAVLSVPNYSNTSMLVYNWGERFGSYSRQSDQGLFTYNVGEQYMPHLMNSLATATTVDGSARVHSKLDNTGFSYIGRSHGVGAPIGLVDDALSITPHATGYTYIESGYKAHVDCIYNSSADFSLQCQDSSYYVVCAAKGYLPNSLPGQQESLDYMGYSSSPIAAIGVTSNPAQPRRMLATATGTDYEQLNNIQCEWEFTPSQFSVSTSFAAKNISVTLVPQDLTSTPEAVDDFEPKGNLTFLANWQFNLMSSDLSSLYSSFLGKSINANIENYRFAHASNSTQPELSDEEATLGGLEAALEAVMDDLLLGYAGAQLMVPNVSSDVDAHLLTRAVKFGQTSWIVAIFAFNIVLLVWTIVEATRTWGWKGLTIFDFTDPAALVLGTAKASKCSCNKNLSESHDKGYHLSGSDPDGKIRIAQRGSSLVICSPS